MREAEARRLPYLFKLRLTRNVRRMIEKLSAREWVNAGQGFWAKESAVRLEGWSRERRVIVLRRRLKGAVGPSWEDENETAQLSFAEIGEATEVYEYSVLVTSIDEETEAFGQLYRDRGDGENIFDELKNQWGWGGFTTHDLVALSAGGATAGALLRLVEHLRPSRRARPASRGHHQPAVVPVGHRDANPPCAPNHDPRHQFSRQGQTRGSRARRRRHLPARPRAKCGAVDPAAKMARDSVARVPSPPQWPPAPPAAAPRTKLMQPKRERPRPNRRTKGSTAEFLVQTCRGSGRRWSDGGRGQEAIGAEKGCGVHCSEEVEVEARRGEDSVAAIAVLPLEVVAAHFVLDGDAADDQLDRGGVSSRV